MLCSFALNAQQQSLNLQAVIEDCSNPKALHLTAPNSLAFFPDHKYDPVYPLHQPIPFAGGFLCTVYYDAPDGQGRSFSTVLIRNNRLSNYQGQWSISKEVSTVEAFHDTFFRFTGADDAVIDGISMRVKREHYYILFGSDDRNAKPEIRILEDLTSSELRIARNYVFAKYGYQFKSDDLKKYFSQFSWYKPNLRDVDVVRIMVDSDREIIAKIQSLEPGVHNDKKKAAPNLPKLLKENEKNITPELASFFFAPDTVKGYEYTFIMDPISALDGTILGLTRESRPDKLGKINYAHSFVYWKGDKASNPVVYHEDPIKANVAHPTVYVTYDSFVNIRFRRMRLWHADGRHYLDNWPRDAHIIISKDDLFDVKNLPLDERQDLLTRLDRLKGLTNQLEESDIIYWLQKK